jgi:hypothetical protein
MGDILWVIGGALLTLALGGILLFWIDQERRAPGPQRPPAAIAQRDADEDGARSEP